MVFGLQHFEIYKKRKNKLKLKHIEVINIRFINFDESHRGDKHTLYKFCK